MVYHFAKGLYISLTITLITMKSNIIGNGYSNNFNNLTEYAIYSVLSDFGMISFPNVFKS